jgi:Protein of unknown function (DUF1698)
MNILDQYVVRLPSAQNVIDLFDGEWSSKMPERSGLHAKPGTAGLFADARIEWAKTVFGGVVDQDILELGPLEAAHSWMLQEAGAKSVTAIEANTRAFLKCLCVKELFELNRVNFQLGDFVAYLDQIQRKFDMVVACGVLYHMADPIRLLDLISKASDKVFIWTHYFDENVITNNSAIAYKFSKMETASYRGFDYRFSLQSYKEALDWIGFCGGPERTSKWLAKDSIIGFLKKAGFDDIQIGFDHSTHQNGPAFAICAQRK